MATLFSTADNNYSPTKWQVNPTAGLGTHTTIASALTSASAGDTIYVMPSTYTENLTLKNGVQLCCADFAGGSGARTVIVGKLIDNGGNVNTTITNITLQTNSDNIIALTGSTSTIILTGCNINCSNNTGFNIATGTSIKLYTCIGDLGTTGIGFHTGAGTTQYYNCVMTNSGSSLTLSTTSGTTLLEYSVFANGFSTSSTGAVNIYNSVIDASAINTIVLTTVGTGTSKIANSRLLSGTASTLSIGAGTTVDANISTISSSNTNAITGAGTLTYSELSFNGVTNLINTTTQTLNIATAFQKSVIQVFTGNGTYTPTAGMKYCIIEAVGGGGGGGGISSIAGGGAGSGGGGGGYSRGVFSAVTIGNSQTVTIGGAGTAGANTGTNGGPGGTTTVGALISCTGGNGGTGATTTIQSVGGTGGTGSGGTVNITGGTGGGGQATVAISIGGSGGSSIFGFGAGLITRAASGGGAGQVGSGFGAGGGAAVGTTTANAGGAGTAGYVAVTEFI